MTEVLVIGRDLTLADDENLVYTRHGARVHITRHGLYGVSVLCGTVEGWMGWFGTGSQDEYDLAARMPACISCLARHRPAGGDDVRR